MVSRADDAPALATVFLTRVAFFDRIEERFIPFDGGTYTICYLHFDHLRRFNRIHGIEAGDNVLRSMAIWLRGIAEDGLVARYGGDGFVMLVRSVLAEGLADNLNAQLPTYGEPEGLCAQIGATFCVRNTSPADCVERACFAYETIREDDARHFRLFDAELERVFDIRHYVVDHLDDAIARGEIRAWAQPICRVLTGQICEVEILARWESERFGFLRPDQFVPELERHALIHKLDLEIIRLACAQWTEAHALSANVPFGINLSRLDFELCDIYQHVRTYMRQYGVPVEQVHIEVTESITARDDDVVAEGVRRFREAGFSVYMDDFGTGYSSLGTMASLRFDVVKIDKSLVDHVTDDERARAVLADTVAMIKRLGMQTLCEGVETEEQLQFLRAIGCEKAQGYLIRRPCSHPDVMETLVEQSRNHENAPDEIYFDTVGKINLLDGSSPITHGVEAATFMGHSPIAVLEFSGGKIKLLTCNYAYQRLLRRMGFDNLDDFVAYTSAGSGRVNARATRAAQLAKQTGHVQHFDFIVGNTFCSASMRLVAQTETRDAFLNLVTSVENAPQVTEHTLLAGVLESSGRKFFWKDTQRRFLGANQAFLDYYGFQSMADIIGKTDEDMGWHVEVEPYRSDEMLVLEGETINNAPGVCWCRGELRDIVATKRPLVSNGAVVGLVGFFKDVGPHKG